jgi:hypothetical protein
VGAGGVGRDGECVKEERRVGLLMGEAGSEDVRDRFGEVASNAVKTLRSESAKSLRETLQGEFSLASYPGIQCREAGRQGGREGRALR